MITAALGAAACGGAPPTSGAPAELAGKSPGDAYAAYTAAIANAVVIDDVYPFMTRANRAKSASASESLRPLLLETMKGSAPTGLFVQRVIERALALLAPGGRLQYAR